MGIPERNNATDSTGRAEGVEEGTPGAGAGIPLDPLESATDAGCPLQLIEVHGGTEIHLWSVQDLCLQRLVCLKEAVTPWRAQGETGF